MKLFALILILAVPLFSASLTVRVNGIKTFLGNIRVKLARTAAVYENNSLVDYFQKVRAERQNVAINFESLPEGIYAVKIFHDRNGNDKMDRTILGLPAEPYGFSNNICPKTRAANFTEAKFTLSGSDTIDIILK